VTTPAIDAFAAIGKNYSWPDVTVISADPVTYGQEAESVRAELTTAGFKADYKYANNNDWNQIQEMMRGLRADSKGKKRVYFLVGNEDYFRKVVCASLVSEAEPGIVWLSKGAWKDEWWM
jgi:hypothetical protein